MVEKSNIKYTVYRSLGGKKQGEGKVLQPAFILTSKRKMMSRGGTGCKGNWEKTGY